MKEITLEQFGKDMKHELEEQGYKDVVLGEKHTFSELDKRVIKNGEILPLYIYIVNKASTFDIIHVYSLQLRRNQGNQQKVDKSSFHPVVLFKKEIKDPREDLTLYQEKDIEISGRFIKFDSVDSLPAKIKIIERHLQQTYRGDKEAFKKYLILKGTINLLINVIKTNDISKEDKHYQMLKKIMTGEYSFVDDWSN